MCDTFHCHLSSISLPPSLIQTQQSHQSQPTRPPPPQYTPPKGPIKAGPHQRLGTPHHGGPPPPAGTPHAGAPAPINVGTSSSATNQLTIPDPFTRKVSRLPKKHLTQNSSRFQPRRLPPDYKPLPLLKGMTRDVEELSSSP